MTFLVAFTICFGVFHVLGSLPRAKTKIRNRFGKAWGAIYGIVSLALLIAMVAKYRSAEVQAVYATPFWGWWANWALSFAGFLSLGIFLFRGSWRNGLRYPMALAVCLWGAGHLCANGDTRSLVFFGGLMITSLVQVFVSHRQEFTSTPVRQGHNLLSILFGIALYGIMTQLHYAVTGMELITLK